jgi:hypothetical protein
MTKIWLGEHYPLGLGFPHFEIFHFRISLYDLKLETYF